MVKVADGGQLKSWNNKDTVPCRLLVVNSSDVVVNVLWVTPNGSENSYRTLQPGQLHRQATFSTHVWRLRAVHSRRLLAEHVGLDTTIELLGDGRTVTVLDGYRQDVQTKGNSRHSKQWGSYRQRALSANGIPIMAWDCVGDVAIVTAADILERMCEHTPAAVLRRMVDTGCDVAIIGRHQVTSDMPPHASLKGATAGGGGRTFDDGCRGVGGSPLIPTTSAGEENVTMFDDRSYPSEQIMIHEFGHTVMDVGLAAEQREAIRAAHRAATEQQLYDPDCYMASNPQEYFAEGTQAWFDATVREDVTSGINTREKLKRHDPRLASLLAAAYGDGPWRYPQTAPAPFAAHGGRRKQQQLRARTQRFSIRRLFSCCLPSPRQYSKVS